MNEQKSALGRKILSLKKKRGATWKQIGQRLGHSPVWSCAACLGQMPMSADAAAKAGELFGLTGEEQAVLEQAPYRGCLPTHVPADPLIYRFYEVVNVYGTTLKEMIEEEFGDGIMSAVDFEMAVDRQPDPKGDRVRVTMSGKFLPYKCY